MKSHAEKGRGTNPAPILQMPIRLKLSFNPRSTLNERRYSFCCPVVTSKSLPDFLTRRFRFSPSATIATKATMATTATTTSPFIPTKPTC